MTEPKFTPGPWLRTDGDTMVYALEHDGYRRGEEAFRNRFHASIYLDRRADRSEGIANAALIAAAPELYTALERLLEDYRREMPYAFTAAIHNAVAALEKARGEKK